MRKNNNHYGPANLAGAAAEKRIVTIAKERLDLADKHIHEVYEKVPKEYHKSIRLLPKNVLIWNKEFELSPEHLDMGIKSYEGKTFVSICRPYVDVEGRVTNMIDVHKKHETEYKLITYSEQIGEMYCITCEFEGLNIHGVPTKTIERSIINFGGTGVDVTNPIENASTSAVGRALGLAGYGLIGSGLTSFEDMYLARSKEQSINNKRAAAADKIESDNTDRQHLPQENSNGNKVDPITSESNETIKAYNRAKNAAVSRLIKLTKEMSPGYVQENVSKLLGINFDGKFKSLDLEQMEIVENQIRKYQDRSRVS